MYTDKMKPTIDFIESRLMQYDIHKNSEQIIKELSDIHPHVTTHFIDDKIVLSVHPEENEYLTILRQVRFLKALFTSRLIDVSDAFAKLESVAREMDNDSGGDDIYNLLHFSLTAENYHPLIPFFKQIKKNRFVFTTDRDSIDVVDNVDLNYLVDVAELPLNASEDDVVDNQI
jgi:hypothetical protein